MGNALKNLASIRAKSSLKRTSLLVKAAIAANSPRKKSVECTEEVSDEEEALSDALEEESFDDDEEEVVNSKKKAVVIMETPNRKRPPVHPSIGSRSTNRSTSAKRKRVSVNQTSVKKAATPKKTIAYGWESMGSDEVAEHINGITVAPRRNCNKDRFDSSVDKEEAVALFKQAFRLGLFEEDILGRSATGKGKKTKPLSFLEVGSIKAFGNALGFSASGSSAVAGGHLARNYYKKTYVYGTLCLALWRLGCWRREK